MAAIVRGTGWQTLLVTLQPDPFLNFQITGLGFQFQLFLARANHATTCFQARHSRSERFAASVGIGFY